MIYYFVEFAGSFANIALLVLFVDRLFQKKDLSSRWFYLYIALLIVGQCLLSLFPTWVMPRTIYFLLGGFLLAILFYEAQIWQAIFASAAFFTLVAVVEVLAMLLMGLQVSDTDALMQAGSARLIYVVFSNLIQIPLLILISHFFSRKEYVLPNLPDAETPYSGICTDARKVIHSVQRVSRQFGFWFWSSDTYPTLLGQCCRAQ